VTVLLRAGVLAALAAALLVPEPRPAPAAGRVVRISGALPRAVADSLLVGAPPALVARASDHPPGAEELDALAAAVDRAPLLVRLPATIAQVEAAAPRRPRVGRAAAVPFRLRFPAGDTVRVRLSDAAGTLDSLRVVVGPDGAAEGAFRVRPARPGWREWTVEAAGRSARVGAWVAPGGEPRVLVAAGPPSWESRFVVRALEESGATVEFSQSLGRGLAVRQGGGGVPADPRALAAFDAVLLLAGADVGPAQRAALAEYASRRGGGVLLAGGSVGAGALRVAEGAGEAEVTADRIGWSLPAELAPLPAATLRSSAAPFARLLPGAVVAAGSPRGTLLALRPAGRGRAAALALTETWRWRMEAGAVAEHREFWRSLVDWLASAPRDSLAAEVAAPLGAVGVPVEVRVFAPGAEGAPPPALTLSGPAGRREALPVTSDPARPGALLARFVPARRGLHTLAFGEGEPAAGFRAADSLPAADAWARLALLADRSGGAALPPAAFDAEVARREAALPAGSGGGFPWRWLLLALAATLAVAEWTVRRLAGRP
jgi:hypothetical protein